MQVQSTIEPPLSPQQKVAQLRAQQQQQPTPQPLTPDKAAAGDAGSPVATPLKEPHKAAADRPAVKLAWGATPPEDQPAPEPEAAQKSGAGGGQARAQGGGAKDDAEAAERRRLRNQRKKVAQKRKKVRSHRLPNNGAFCNQPPHLTCSGDGRRLIAGQQSWLRPGPEH